jgi:hypothetical protein
MPLDIDKIVTLTGINADNDDAFAEAFNKKFLTEEQIFKDETTKSRIFGRAFGSATTAVKQLFEASGVELTGDDLKQPLEAVVKLGVHKLDEKFKVEKQDLERTAGLTADEKIKEINEALQKKESKIKDFEKLLKDKATEFEQLQNSKNQELKSFKLKSVYKDVANAINFLPEKDEYARKGFLTSLQEKYVIDLDENDEPFIVEKSSGSRIKAEGTHSTFMTPVDVYKMVAIKEGMAAVNKKSGLPPATPKPPSGKPQGKQEAPPSPLAGKRVMANTSWRPPSD